ncbi:hypothetical protein E2C01_078678 [Portunus trituberculatus]|uniref:Uncharacterized protein n=1 Tax=Portunus trituberculatus TaxID=210409 RepID=A0A5B7INE7_PORTR|nr:hypothetical protein [Portunus trituberculatus]
METRKKGEKRKKKLSRGDERADQENMTEGEKYKKTRPGKTEGKKKKKKKSEEAAIVKGTGEEEKKKQQQNEDAPERPFLPQPLEKAKLNLCRS